MKYSLLLPLATFFCFFACTDQKIDTTLARKEMEAREIKVVSEAQIMRETMRLGKELIRSFEVQALNATEDIRYKVDYGSDTLWEKTFYLFEQTYDLEGKRFEVFDAYKYNWEEGLPSEPNVQKLAGGTQLLFTAPMMNEGKTIGMWAITFPRKEVVLGIEL